MKTVMVIGGGITGLSTMYYLQKIKREQNLDIKLILVEKNEKLGGKIATINQGEFIMETGADSIVANKDNVMPFIEELKLTDEVVYNATGKSYIYLHNTLMQVPEDTVFGIPTSMEALMKSPLVSYKGKLEAHKDLITRNKTFTKDSSIGEFLEAFLGKEYVENQIAPILSGVYSGKLEDLLISSTLPYLLDYKNKYGSIIRGLGKHHKPAPTANNKKFLSFKNGLSTIIDRLEQELTDVTILKGVETDSVERNQEHYDVSFVNHETIEADYVVLSTPFNVAQEVLHHEELNSSFNKLQNSSVITMYMGFDVPDSRLPKEGTGFINSGKGDLLCNACTWTSRKWTHTSSNRQLLVRLFYKNILPNFDELNQMTEEELVQIALKDMEKSFGITEKPKTVEVTKWTELMPTYNLDHGDAIQSLNEKLSTIYPHIILAGCSYYGVGIPSCITNGIHTAEKIASELKVVKK
ncbi:protoporphyrinogen oxidase [Bacillus massiliigorillae]|uniref:protoporphyrinogen oxidase n=1 Tax=Bacillus massiliigorillae TaxID=1243664 RepID=UPI0003A7699A|nr:protoporphyrinogen oxidase [Bacillus massiliigorillae]